MTTENIEINQIDAQTVRQLVQLVGLDLSLDRAAALTIGLEEILKVDARIVRLDLGTLTAVGGLWDSKAPPHAK